MMDIHKKIEQFISQHALISDNAKIVVGLSGGPDSVFLLHFLATLQKKKNISLIAAHLNHEWRSQADEEENLCRSIAQRLNIPFVSAKISTLTASYKKNGSQEEYGRKMRRAFLEKVLLDYNADSIALAHHLQDQEETFFIRLVRGSSLTGLTAMYPRNGDYIRPLLEINKQDILAWLNTHTIPYAIDATNESDLYLRSRIRTQALPALRTCDARFDTNFLITMQRLQKTELFLQKITQERFESISEHKEDKLIINITELLKTEPALLHRVIIHWLIQTHVPFDVTQAFLDELLRFLETDRGGSHAIHTHWSVIKKQKYAHIAKH
jgi:tRNA(Ile)-lysidine synthetase-like protein